MKNATFYFRNKFFFSLFFFDDISAVDARQQDIWVSDNSLLKTEKSDKMFAQM